MWETIVNALGGNILGGVAEIIKQFNLPPEQAAALQQSLATTEANLKTAIIQAEAQDRASARQREMTLQDRTPAILAFAITAGFFGMLGVMMFEDLPVTGQEALLVMLGSLGTGWVAVVSYYFGSSAGSTAKSALLAKKGIGG